MKIKLNKTMTGGNCTAYEGRVIASMPSSPYILVTDNDLSVPLPSDKVIGISVYAKEDDAGGGESVVSIAEYNMPLGKGATKKNCEDAVRDFIVRKIAEKFRDVLKGYLTADEFREMRNLNKKQTDENICHSHDHCDANMAMDEALRFYGFAAVLDEQMGEPGGWAANEEAAAVWNAVWNYAKKNFLTAK